MAEELSYLFITPYTIMKSRTGGVIARLLSRSDLDLVGVKMLTPTKKFAEEYAASVEKTVSKRDRKAAKLISDYIRNNFIPVATGKRQRVMMLLFKGENACRKLYSVAGHLQSTPVIDEAVTGETIRDTYADMVVDPQGEVKYFEPAVLTPPTIKCGYEKFKLLADFMDTQPNIVENVLKVDEKSERTLVIIKPDNWHRPSIKPGNIIDMFSRTGLRIVGCKIYQMSVAEALEFYGPVKDVLKKKLAPLIGQRSREFLEEDFAMQFPKSCDKKLADIIGIYYAKDQFSQIIEFMSGMRPEDCPQDKRKEPGLVKCMVLVYEGKNAVKKIRDVLGPTDPTKAPDGTIRREFGQNVMVNTAHASDSVENAKREMKIIKIQDNNVSELIREYLKNQLQKSG